MKIKYHLLGRRPDLETDFIYESREYFIRKSGFYKAIN